MSSGLVAVSRGRGSSWSSHLHYGPDNEQKPEEDHRLLPAQEVGARGSQQGTSGAAGGHYEDSLGGGEGEGGRGPAGGDAHMAAILPARTRTRLARGCLAWTNRRLLTPLISIGFAQDVEAKGVPEALQCQDAADVPLVKAISATSKGDGRGQVEDPPVEDLSWIRPPFGVRPDRGAATHVETVGG